MLKNITADRAILSYGGFVLSENKRPIAFGRDLDKLPTGLPPEYTFENGSINVASISIEQLSTYDNFVVVGMTLDRSTSRGDVSTESLGLWQQTKKGWKLISVPYKLEPAVQKAVAELLADNESRSCMGVRVVAPRNTAQSKIHKLAEICGLTEGHWEIDKDGKEVYLTYEYGTRNFDPYNDEFWVWEIIKRVGLTVHHPSRHLVTLTHPNPEYVFKQTDVGVRPLRQQLCDWLLDVTAKRERR